MAAASTFVCITGGSRGFGRAVAIAFAQCVGRDVPLHVRVAGRAEEELMQTRSQIMAVRSDAEVETVVADLSSLEGLEGVSERLFSLPPDREYGSFVFINNAGSLGPLSYVGQHPTAVLPEMSKAFDLNVTSSCFLSSEVARRCNHGGPISQNTKVVIVNVSSLCAIQPFDSWGIYCAGKAAREMYHRVLAEEINAKNTAAAEASTPPVRLRILNYAPGPLDTDMQREIRECPTVHKATQDYFRSLKESNQLANIHHSSVKLARIVLMEAYANGQHLDFFDAVESIATTCCSCSFCVCVDCQCKAQAKPQCEPCAAK